MINSSLFLWYTLDVKLTCVCRCWLPRCKLGNFCFSLSLSTIWWMKDYRSNKVLKINIQSCVLLVVYKVYVISQATA